MSRSRWPARAASRPWAVACSWFVLAAAACGGGGLSPLPPASRPGPAPAPAAAPPPAGFRYATGDGRMLVESRAIIEVATDTVLRRDTSATSVWLTYRIGDGPAARAVEVTVDSVLVFAGPLVPPNPLLPRPVRYDGQLESGRMALPLDEARASDCASPLGALHGVAREVLPTLPARLSPGARWEESVTSTSCRGGVVLTIVAHHRYAVPTNEPLTSSGLTRVQRTTELRVSGSGSQAGAAVSASGSGSGTAELFVDQGQGRFAGGTSRSRLELAFTGAGREQRVVQNAEQRMRPLEPR